MAKKKHATPRPESSPPKAHAGNGRVQEKLTNKAEAIRRALAKLGKKALPAQIQDFIKAHFGIEMATKVISVYKSKLTKKKGKPGRKPRIVSVTAEAAATPAAHGGVTFRDLRGVKEIGDRLGHARMRELVELLAD